MPTHIARHTVSKYSIADCDAGSSTSPAVAVALRGGDALVPQVLLRDGGLLTARSMHRDGILAGRANGPL
jgi:hypothetical protein